MFENIIEQAAASQLQNDILAGTLPQSILFFGHSESGKGSAALELARVLSCEQDASWKCKCFSCERHRYLQSDDLLVLGKKNFSAEIAACCSVFLQNPLPGTKLLFFRSLRKLQIRFSPFVAENDPKISKISSQLQSLDEKLNDFYSIDPAVESPAVEKLCNALVKEAAVIEEDGISSNIPIGHIRQASYWCRLAPAGKRKILIIENADNMRDEAHNSLLKLLEEPPREVNIVLAAQRKESIIPTILSRLRPYRFLNRSPEGEKEVLRRVFQSPNFTTDNTMHSSLISRYFDSFLPASAEKMYPLAQWFITQDYSVSETAKALLAKSNNFENDSFSRFLKICLDLTSAEARKAKDPQYIRYYDLYKKYINEAVTAVDVLNQSVTIALEALLFKLKNKMDLNYA
ncbi:MAG: DNA polymerase III [Treponema sp.]|jgi:DNA polymerase-3 subunit gamma/tau|nr:DNA polymerase III [Treponema sp.]